jgi:siderophore synthetase component
MKLEKISFGQPLSNTIYGERFLNDTKGHFKDYSEVNPKYDPQGTIPLVELPYTLLQEESVIVFKSLPPKEMTDWVYKQGYYIFPWHPDVARDDFVINGKIKTQPTSSTRTLLKQDQPAVYIKTDLDKKHFRFIRRLRKNSVEHSINICDDLRKLLLQLTQNCRYAFLPESLGLVVKGGKHDGSGVIFREAQPYPHTNDVRVIIPYHALYADDPKQPEDDPLLIQIINLHAGKNKLDYFISEIIGPIIESWVMLVSKRGLLPELHGQNALAEIDSSFRIKRVVHRDFQGTYSDSSIRTLNGLPLFSKHVAGDEPGTTVQAQCSQVFDGMIGRYLISRLINVFCKYFKTEYSNVSSLIREYHRSIPEWNKAQFPSTTYKFGTKAKEQIGNEVYLIDTGEKPEFR